MVEEQSGQLTLKPLKIKCTDSDCSNNLHCFLKTKRLAARGRVGRCRNCEADLVDWPRVSRRDVSDVEYTFEALRLELIRHHFWHIPLTSRAINHAKRKGRVILRSFARKQLQHLIGNARNHREGYQTARETSRNANAVHFAQHATASCCRKCVEEWHGIPPGRAMSETELDYFTQLVMRYLDDRIPELTDEGAVIPPIRNQRSQRQSMVSAELDQADDVH